MDRNEGSKTVGANLGDDGVEVSNLNINTSQGVESVSSGDKRKRRVERARKGKMDNAAIIGEHLKTMASAIESHVAAIITKKEDLYSIGIAMAELYKLTPVMDNIDFYGRCCEILMKKDA